VSDTPQLVVKISKNSTSSETKLSVDNLDGKRKCIGHFLAFLSWKGKRFQVTVRPFTRAGGVAPEPWAAPKSETDERSRNG
jgi:hypothetical protein